MTQGRRGVRRTAVTQFDKETNSLTDSSTRRPDRDANKRARASLQLYADKVKDSGEKELFFNVLPYRWPHPAPGSCDLGPVLRS